MLILGGKLKCLWHDNCCTISINDAKKDSINLLIEHYIILFVCIECIFYIQY